jgi:hypothetical protein
MGRKGRRGSFASSSDIANLLGGGFNEEDDARMEEDVVVQIENTEPNTTECIGHSGATRAIHRLKAKLLAEHHKHEIKDVDVPERVRELVSQVIASWCFTIV